MVHVPQCLFDILLGNVRRAFGIHGDSNTHVVDVPIGFVFVEFPSDGDVHPVWDDIVPQPVVEKHEASAGASRIVLIWMQRRSRVREEADVLRLAFEATDAMLCRLLDSSNNLVESPEDRVIVVFRKPRILGESSPSPSDVSTGVLLYVPNDGIDLRVIYLGNLRKKIVEEGVNLEFKTVRSRVAKDSPTAIWEARC